MPVPETSDRITEQPACGSVSFLGLVSELELGSPTERSDLRQMPIAARSKNSSKMLWII